MDLAKHALLVEEIHTKVAAHEGRALKIRANLGRSKVIDCEGVLTQVHPSIFIVEVHGKRGRITRQSYQYADVLTGMVELTDIESNERIYVPPVED